MKLTDESVQTILSNFKNRVKFDEFNMITLHKHLVYQELEQILLNVDIDTKDLVNK